jgi:cell wall-associated NlpC family hydrolase
LGTPYHHMASVKGPQGGVDCAYFLIDVYATAGAMDRFVPEPYPQDWHLHRDAERYLEEVMRRCGKVDVPELGDIVVFQYGRTFSHGGFVVAWPEIIHAYFGLGVIYGDGEQGELAKAQQDGTEVSRRHMFYSPWKDPNAQGEAPAIRPETVTT